MSSYCTAALGNEKHWCVHDLVRADLRPVSPVFGTVLLAHLTNKKKYHTFKTPVSDIRTSSCIKRTKGFHTRELAKYSSSLEVKYFICLKQLMVSSTF